MNCPHCNTRLVWEQRYTGGRGYGWYLVCACGYVREAQFEDYLRTEAAA
jgi:hypothetical protein